MDSDKEPVPPGTQLSPNFTFGELTHTDTGLPNVPSEHETELLTRLAQFLEKVRTRALDNTPMSIDSAFRSDAVNKRVGGVPTSAHRLCYACDFTDEQYGPPLKCALSISAAADRGLIVFDQLIYEQHESGPAGDWVHISRDPRARMQRLTRLPDGSYINGLHAR